MERDRLLALFEEAPTYMSVIEGPDLHVTGANRLVRESMPQVIGRSMRDVLPGDNPIVSAIARVYATGAPELIHGHPPYLRERAQSDRFFTRIFVPLRDDGGTIYGVLGLAHEVTEEVRAVHAREEVERRSQLELRRLAVLLEETPALICVLEGPELRVVMMNRFMREMFADRNLYGTSLHEIVPATNTTLQAACRVYRTGVPETLELVVAHVAGFVGRSFSTTVVPIRDPDGHIGRIMTVSFDITEQRRARAVLEVQARELEAARREAVQASQAKDDFLAMLSHELRNPLASIVLTLASMRMQNPAGSPELSLLDRQVRHLVRLVDDLLDVSRIARGQLELACRDVELPQIVLRALETSRPQLERRQQRVVSDLAPATVRGDPDRLAQVVANLVTNAAKYSELGSQIRIRTESAGPLARITVADDGAGIAPDMLARVFDAFVQQPQTLARSGGGLGLGLSIVKSLVEAHGGTVRARSPGEGQGSTFIIDLPTAGPGPHPAAPHPTTPPPTPRRRILVVDDNQDAALALKNALESLGQTVAVAHDADAALAEAAAFHPEVGLLDLGLPGMDGYQLAEALRRTHPLRLFAITGYGHPRDRQRSHAAGFEEHLLKPLDLDQLTGLVARLSAG